MFTNEHPSELTFREVYKVSCQVLRYLNNEVYRQSPMHSSLNKFLAQRDAWELRDTYPIVFMWAEDAVDLRLNNIVKRPHLTA